MRRPSFICTAHRSLPESPYAPRTFVEGAFMRRTSVLGILVAAIVATTIGMATPASAAPVQDQQSGMPTVDTAGSAFLGSTQPMAQLFVPRSSGLLTSVKLPIAKYMGHTVVTNFTIAIMATENGQPSGAPLASVTIDANAANLTENRTSPPSVVTAVFNSPPTVVAGSIYAITFTTPDPYESYHWFSGNYCATSWRGAPSGSGFQWFPDYALAFETYVDGTAVPSGDLPAPVVTGFTPQDEAAQIIFATCVGTGTQPASGVTSVEYSIDGSNTWQSTELDYTPWDPGARFTLTGLDNGDPTSVRVRVVAGGSTSEASEPFTVVAGVPEAPKRLVLTPIAGGVQISFTLCYNGGSPVTDIQYASGSPWTSLSPTVTGSPITITGLTDGELRGFNIRVVTANAVSSESEHVQAVIGAGNPVTSGTVVDCVRADDTPVVPDPVPVSAPPMTLPVVAEIPTSVSITVPVTQAPTIAPVTSPSTTPVASPAQVSASLGVTLVQGDAAVRVQARPVVQGGASLKKAPTSKVVIGQPTRLTVGGLEPGQQYTIKMRTTGSYLNLGTVEVDAKGRVILPAFTATRSTRMVIALVNDAGDLIYVKVSPKRA
jgi:hypothetical protein